MLDKQDTVFLENNKRFKIPDLSMRTLILLFYLFRTKFFCYLKIVLDRFEKSLEKVCSVAAAKLHLGCLVLGYGVIIKYLLVVNLKAFGEEVLFHCFIKKLSLKLIKEVYLACFVLFSYCFSFTSMYNCFKHILLHFLAVYLAPPRLLECLGVDVGTIALYIK